MATNMIIGGETYHQYLSCRVHAARRCHQAAAMAKPPPRAIASDSRLPKPLATLTPPAPGA